MPTTTTDGIEIYWETRGDQAGMPIVLVHGFGASFITWHEGFIAELVAAGFFVVLIDSRDVGLSQATGGPDDLDGGYSLTDMAADIVHVLDDLGIAKAHAVGMSMGGMIVQHLALDHPDRVASLGLFGTTPASVPEFLVGSHSGEAWNAPQQRLSRDDYVAMSVTGSEYYHSPAFDFDAAGARELAERYYDRRYLPDGLPRQWRALVRGADDRRERLSTLTIPAVIFHGTRDRSLHWRAAIALAEAIPDAELHLYAGMGHDVPRELWPVFAEALARTARRGERGPDAALVKTPPPVVEPALVDPAPAEAAR